MRLAILLLGVLMSGPLFASGDKITQSNDMNNQTTGDVTNQIGGDSSTAIGIGHALGDVDIAQCLGSTQWGTPVFSKQKLVVNWPCMAEFYLENGSPELAAMALCNTEIVDEFRDEEECELAHSFLASIPPPATTVPTPGPDGEGYRPDGAGEVSEYGAARPEDVELVQRELDLHEEEYDDLEQRIARIESGQRAAAKKAQERREFAIQTMEKLQNDPEE